MTPPSRTAHRAAAACLVAVATLTTACSGGSSDDSSASGGSATSAEAPRAAAVEEDGAVLDQAGTAFTANKAEAPEGPDRKVISTGNVALRADDVAKARFDVQEVVDEHGGEVAEERTATDDDGEVERSRLVLRVPSARFDEAVESLTGVAELVDASTTSEDVTTQVLDVDIRVRVQRRSIARIELLLDRAESIRDIVVIEAQLSRRQAALASLEKQQDYLADQTSMSTITVSLERTPKARTVAEEDDDSGFLSGLAAGWDGLSATTVAAATVVGALLPFAAVALLVAVPAWPLLRRLRRRRLAAE
ncbi:DUF4349 domain-containing protein [Nocardioides sp. Arc9.136]|uniref:DUF4349 domain-containing protein n=1 Tax=Nocardioides sp. Arc9.136 TaxID=2996826 RepID=UPI0026662482|nr:DUF4349 domain-containing protein [Nocardioides sp. Arc9.136]WKN49373.1 DUF4349 domain-containing protein [Nocardioides sp. Arc9.136]